MNKILHLSLLCLYFYFIKKIILLCTINLYNDIDDVTVHTVSLPDAI